MRWDGEIKSRAPTRDAVSLELHPFYGIYCHRDVCSLREKLFGSILRSNCHVLLVNAAWKICSRNRLPSSRAITNRNQAEENIRLDMNIAECHLNCCGCVGVNCDVSWCWFLFRNQILNLNFRFGLAWMLYDLVLVPPTWRCTSKRCIERALNRLMNNYTWMRLRNVIHIE